MFCYLFHGPMLLVEIPCTFFFFFFCPFVCGVRVSVRVGHATSSGGRGIDVCGSLLSAKGARLVGETESQRHVRRHVEVAERQPERIPGSVMQTGDFRRHPVYFVRAGWRHAGSRGFSPGIHFLVQVIHGGRDRKRGLSICIPFLTRAIGRRDGDRGLFACIPF